jgi:beta-galactosidase
VTTVSIADTLAKGSTYASLDLGGITRKIFLFAVPALSIADVHVVTTFADATYTDAFLFMNISLANDGATGVSAGATVAAALTFGGTAEASGTATFAAVAGGGGVVYASLNLSVAAPAHWDTEHPNLHNLTLSLSPPLPGRVAGSTVGAIETVVRRVGFRDVQIVSANRVAINGKVIKARGTTRHDSNAVVGRSLWTLAPAGGQWARDIAMFRDVNINYIRTSHYPPAEELMEAADELGMFIEVGAPLCCEGVCICPPILLLLCSPRPL